VWVKCCHALNRLMWCAVRSPLYLFMRCHCEKIWRQVLIMNLRKKAQLFFQNSIFWSKVLVYLCFSRQKQIKFAQTVTSIAQREDFNSSETVRKLTYHPLWRRQFLYASFRFLPLDIFGFADVKSVTTYELHAEITSERCIHSAYFQICRIGARTKTQWFVLSHASGLESFPLGQAKRSKSSIFYAVIV